MRRVQSSLLRPAGFWHCWGAAPSSVRGFPFWDLQNEILTYSMYLWQCAANWSVLPLGTVVEGHCFYFLAAVLMLLCELVELANLTLGAFLSKMLNGWFQPPPLFVPDLLHVAVVVKQLAMNSFSLSTVWQRELELILEVLFVWRAKEVKFSWKWKHSGFEVDITDYNCCFCLSRETRRETEE